MVTPNGLELNHSDHVVLNDYGRHNCLEHLLGKPCVEWVGQSQAILGPHVFVGRMLKPCLDIKWLFS